jgi:hypothetical protein
VIHFYVHPDHPIYLIDAFSKNEKDNLTKAERNALAKSVEALKAALRGRAG